MIDAVSAPPASQPSLFTATTSHAFELGRRPPPSPRSAFPSFLSPRSFGSGVRLIHDKYCQKHTSETRKEISCNIMLEKISKFRMHGGPLATHHQKRDGDCV